MEAYSSLFTAGLRAQAIPRTPPHVHVADGARGAYSGLLEPPLAIVAPSSPSQRKTRRRRKSSISHELNPIAGLKSPTRNARSALMSPVTEKRFFDFNTSSIGTALNFFRRPRVKPPQKPMPTMPLPPIPVDLDEVDPSTPKKAYSTLPPSSPTMPEPVFPSSKINLKGRKLSMERLPKLRLKTSGIFNSRSGPLSASLNVNSRNVSRASSPGLLTPDFGYSATALPSANLSTSALQTPLSAPFNYPDWGMAGVKEVNEEDENGHDVEMNL